MLESDCPYCEIRPSHASHAFLSSLSPEQKELYAPMGVKKPKWSEGKVLRGRNEPMATGLVGFVVAQLKGVAIEEVAQAAWNNSLDLFGPLNG